MSYIQCCICRDGKYRRVANLLRKYFGDLLIASYLVVVQESGFDIAYIEEIEVSVPHILVCSIVKNMHMVFRFKQPLAYQHVFWFSERSFIENSGLFLERPSDKHEQAQLCGEFL